MPTVDAPWDLPANQVSAEVLMPCGSKSITISGLTDWQILCSERQMALKDTRFPSG